MLVRQSTLEAMRQRAMDAESALFRSNNELHMYFNKYRKLLTEWNKLVGRINELGGEAVFEKMDKQNQQFSKEEINKLILLCHPDKHNGKEMATELTQKLLKLR